MLAYNLTLGHTVAAFLLIIFQQAQKAGTEITDAGTQHVYMTTGFQPVDFQKSFEWVRCAVV